MPPFPPGFRASPQRKLACGSLLAAAALFLTAPLAAQTKDAAAPPPAGAQAAGAQTKASDESALERLIYLPYKNLKAVLDKEGATVFLPYSQFLKLWENSHPEGTAGPAQPPVSAVISKAAYVGKVEESLARIDATFTVKSLGKGWAEIPLQFGDAAVGKMTASDERVLLRGTGEGQYALLLPGPGDYNVQLELVSRVATSTEGRTFELKCPPVGVTTFELTIPAADQSVEILPHLVSAPVSADGAATKVEASLGATQKIVARWFPRVSKAPEMELLAAVNNQLRVRVADGLVHTDATLTYQVLRGRLDQVKIAVPAGDRILDVTAPNLKDWKIVKEGNRQAVVIDLLSSAEKTLPVEVRTERAAGAEPFEIGGIDDDGTAHGIHPLGMVRESGIVVVGHGSELTLAVEQQQGLMRVEAGEVPTTLRKDDNLYYKFYSPGFQLRVSAKPVEPRIVVAQATRLEFHDDELRSTAKLSYDIERAGIFELSFKVPDGLKIDSVDCAPMKEYSVSPDGGTLTVSLNEKTAGRIEATIRGRVSVEGSAAETKLSLPLLEPLAVTREQGSIQVYAPEAIEVVTDEKAIVAALPDQAAAAESLPNLRLASAWTYHRRPVEIPVTTVRKPTRLSADVATTVNVKEGLVEIASLVDYSVLYAGLDTFRFSVPEAVSAKLQIETLPEDGGPAIMQRDPGAPADGWVVWTITMQREVTGRARFRVKYDLPTETKGNAAQIAVRPLRVLGLPGEDPEQEKISLARISGEISVHKDRALSIAAQPQDLEAIDVRELTRLPQDGYLAYRYFKQPVELGLTATKHDVQEVVQTVVSRALVEAIVTQEDQIAYRARFLLKTSERQRLALELPTKTELLGVTVAGKQITLEKNPTSQAGSDSYFVNVARAGRSDEPFYLTLLYRVPGDAPANWPRGALTLPLPRLRGADSRQAGVALQQLRVVAWVPPKFALVGTPDHFALERPLRLRQALRGRTNAVTDTSALNQWIGDSGTSFFEFPTAGHAYEYSNLGGTERIELYWWRTAWMTWFFSGLVLPLIAVVLVRTSWENKVGVLLLAAFVLALAAMQDPDFVVHLLAAGRYGLAALLAFWLIYALSRSRPAAAPQRSAPVYAGGPVVAAVIPPPGIFDMFQDGKQDPPAPK